MGDIVEENIIKIIKKIYDKLYLLNIIKLKSN